jgi:hypothetical protein
MCIMDKKVILKILKEEFMINESGYPRVANMLRGLVPSIRTIGIITAQNPNGIKETDEYHKRANYELVGELRRMNLGPIPVKGKYGSEEDSFIVPNITYNELMGLGEKYKQESVVYGEKTTTSKDGKDYTGMEFKMIHTDSLKGKQL